MMIGKQLPFCDGKFSGAMLNFQGVKGHLSPTYGNNKKNICLADEDFPDKLQCQFANQQTSKTKGLGKPL